MLSLCYVRSTVMRFFALISLVPWDLSASRNELASMTAVDMSHLTLDELTLLKSPACHFGEEGGAGAIKKNI